MAGEVRLDLQVGLDTAYLRNQLSTIGTKLGGQQVTIPVEFSDKSIKKQLNLLQERISGKTYNLKIESTTLEVLATKVKNFQERLKKLQSESITLDIAVGGVTSISKRDAESIKRNLRDAVLGGDKKIFIRTSIRPAISRQDVRDFTNAVKSKLAGIAVDVKIKTGSQGGGFAESPLGHAGLMEYMRSQGMVGKVASGMKMQMQGDANIEESLKNVEQKAKKLANDLTAMGEAARSTGRAFIEEAGKVLRPQNYGFKINSLTVDVEKLGDTLRQADQVTARSLLPQLASLTSTLRTAASSFVGVFGANKGLDSTLLLFDREARQAAYATASYADRIERLAGSGMMLPAGAMPTGLLSGTSFAQQKRLVGDILSPSLKEALRGAANAFVDSVTASLGNAVRQVSVRDLGNTVQRTLQAQRIAGLLPPGVGRAPSVYATGAVGGETRAAMFARREQEARVRSALRGVGLGQHFTERPRLSGTTFMGDDFTAGGGRDRVRGVGQPPERGGELGFFTRGAASPLPKDLKAFNAALDAARASMKNFQGQNAPFIGGLRGIASEFGGATKQVLLYGTAYKGLAFITSLPGQIINAAKGQQQFANAMQVATQETRTFGKEMLFVDNVQRTFGLNLESTRTGFTRLFASMAPTGFDSGAIEKLFVGISAAAASLQMTPDKVDRVIYAFGQMASKGQIMSEELKGQLGDVLPGALALFAKAAGMSVKDFSKAMEDGQFVGGRFQEIFAKVSDELINRFGTGAQVASRSIVGLTNKVQGEFTRTLEALAPFANAAIQAVLGPLPTVLREIGTAAQLSSGEIGRLQLQLETAQKELKDLQDTPGIDPKIVQGAAQSVAAYKVRIEELNEASKDPAIQQRAKDIKAFTDELTKAGTFVMNLARSLGNILGPIVTTLGGSFMTVASTIISFALAIQGARLAAMALSAALMVVRGVSAALGILNLARQLGSFSAALAASGTNAKALAGAMRFLGIQMSAAQVQAIGLRKVLFALGASTFVGLVVGGIGLIATALASLGDKAGEAARKTKEAINSIREAARTGQVETIKMDIAASEASQRTLKAAREEVEALKGGEAQGRSSSKMGTIDAADIRPATRAALAMEEIEVKSAGKISQSALVQQIKAAEAVQATKKREGMQQLPLAVQRQKELRTAVPGPLPPDVSDVATKGSSKAEKAAKRLAEQIAQQARAASDALFAEQQRLLVMQQTNPIAQAIAEYTSQELTIRRELNQQLAEARSQKEKEDIIETSKVKSSANLLELEDKINQARQSAMQPIADLLKSQREQLQVEADIEKLLREGMSPERAKQVAEVRRLFREQLASFDLLQDEAKQAIVAAEARGASADAMERLRGILRGIEEDRKKAEGQQPEAEAGVPEAKPKTTADYISDGMDEAKKNLEKLTNVGYQAVEGARAIGNAFGQAFKDIASGSMSAQEALANMMQSIGSHFLEMAAQIIAQQTVMIILGTIMKALGIALPGGSGGGGDLGSSFTGNFDLSGTSFATMPKSFGFSALADGGIAAGGFKAFANGGIATSPTLGLIGEGRYNEAIVPLPDGRSIPVQMQGNSVRERMNNTTSSPLAPILSMSFESTNINGVEYVSRDQLEAAMAETRRAASRDGAQRGMTMTLDRIQNSPSTRRRIGA
jgi:tape measure domain-containing protein